MTSRPFEVICEIEPPTRPDLKHVRHQIGVLAKVADGLPDPRQPHRPGHRLQRRRGARGRAMGGRSIACLNVPRPQRARLPPGPAHRRRLRRRRVPVRLRRPARARAGRSGDLTVRTMMSRGRAACRRPRPSRAYRRSGSGPPRPCGRCRPGSGRPTSCLAQVSFSLDALLRVAGGHPVDFRSGLRRASWSSPARPWPGSWRPTSRDMAVPGRLIERVDADRRGRGRGRLRAREAASGSPAPSTAST